MREIDLQASFGGARPRAENFQNKRGAVEHLGVPRFFEIAVLNRRERGIDDNKTGARIAGVERCQNRFDFAGSDPRRGLWSDEGHNLAQQHFEVDRLGKPAGLLETRLGRPAPFVAGEIDVNDNRRAYIDRARFTG